MVGNGFQLLNSVSYLGHFYALWTSKRQVHILSCHMGRFWNHDGTYLLGLVVLLTRFAFQM